MQKIYRNKMQVGAPGLVYDSTPHVINSRAVEGDDMLFGIGVVAGSVPGETVAVGDGQFEGITVNTWVKEHELGGPVSIREAGTISVMQWGRVWARLVPGSEPVYGDPVHVVSTGENAGLFSNTGGTVIEGARFYGGNNGDDLAPVELR